MKNLTSLCAAGALSICLAPSLAQAHFQLVYTPETMVEKPGDVPVGLIFWHPFENGHAMDMARPEQVFALSHGRRIDLTPSLSEATFKGAQNEAAAWRATVPVRKMGDYVLVTIAAPYYEQSEDLYIQQFAKSYLNLGQLPSDWADPVGLATEIVPLDKPYNIPAGGIFTGRVLSQGKPVAGAEIEVEYLAAAPDLESFSAGPATTEPLPGGALVVTSDENGYFTYGLPRAGVWGFAALGTGPESAHEGKALSQDAVIWVRAWDMK